MFRLQILDTRHLAFEPAEERLRGQPMNLDQAPLRIPMV